MSTKHGNHGTEQTTEGPDGQTQELSVEAVKGRAELTLLVTYKDGEDRLATASMTRAELWEHVHNCLEALTRLPEAPRG